MNFDAVKNLILGQQLYATLLYSYLCSHVTHEYKLYRRGLRAFPREDLLIEYLQEISPNSSRQEDNLQKSYVALGAQYHAQGYDAVYSVFQKITDKHFKNFLGTPLKNLKFMSAPVDLNKADERVLSFAERYSLNYFLLSLALLTRSQLGENNFKSTGIVQEISIKEVSDLRQGLIDWGQELLLLAALDYCLKNRLLDAINLSAFDVMNPNLNREDIKNRLEKILRLDKLCLALFNACNIPTKINDTFRDFYLAEKIELTPNYRFDLLAYLSALNLKTETKYRHPSGSKIFRATIFIGNSKEFTCENKSKEFVNNEIWRIAYEQMLAPVKRFFESADNKVTEPVSFFIRQVVNVRNLPPMFFAEFGILFADNFSRINPAICAKVMRKARILTDSRTLSDFLSIVCKVNAEKYICVAENVYSYADWLQFSCDGKKIHAAENSRLAEIYDNIVNPTVQLQKKIISTDYRFVQKIQPLSEEIAFYALNINSDAYNYLPFVSLSVAEYYKKIKTKEVNLSTIGILKTNLGDGVSVSVMDSQKPFHFQLKQFTSEKK